MTYTDEPAVLTWMIALAPQRRVEPVGHHWWREMVHDAWRSANDAWEARREEVAIGYETEMAEFAQAHPRPTLRAFMVALSQGSLAPESIYS